jgi:hypothetical protein
MATACKLSLSPVLCFLFSKYGSSDQEALRLAVKEFYSVEDLIKAKERLLDDLTQLKSSVSSPVFNLPYAPARRDGPNRLELVLNDIFALLVCCDLHNLCNLLPTYVTDSVDNIPCQRLLDRDLKFLLLKMEHYEARTSDVYSKIAAILARLDIVSETLRCSSSQAVKSAAQAQALVHTQAPVQVPFSYHAAVSTASTAPAFVPISIASTTDFPPLMGTHGSALNRQNIQSTQHTSSSQSAPVNKNATAVPSWAVTATATAATANSNISISDDNSEKLDSDNDGFTVQTRKKRRHISPLQATSQSTSQPNIGGGGGVTRNSYTQPGNFNGAGLDRGRGRGIGSRRSGRTLMTGRQDYLNRSGRSISRISAVLPVINSKRVFCIDNLSVDVDRDDMANFLYDDLGINFQSLNEVRSRRRRNDLNFLDRKAFRLCIFTSDVEKLLDPSVWPKGVRISDWFFKQPPAGNNNLAPRGVEHAEGEATNDMEIAESVSAASETSQCTVVQAADADDTPVSTAPPASASLSSSASVALSSSNSLEPTDTFVDVPISPPVHESSTLHAVPDHDSGSSGVLDTSATILYDSTSSAITSVSAAHSVGSLFKNPDG